MLIYFRLVFRELQQADVFLSGGHEKLKFGQMCPNLRLQANNINAPNYDFHTPFKATHKKKNHPIT